MGWEVCSTYPHGAVGQAFAPDKPFVNVDEDGKVKKAGTESPEDALGDDQLPDVSGERGGGNAACDEQNARDAAGPAVPGVALHDGEAEGRSEIHEALRKSIGWSFTRSRLYSQAPRYRWLRNETSPTRRVRGRNSILEGRQKQMEILLKVNTNADR